MMLAKNKTIGRNRKAMKIEWEFYRINDAFEVLPRITFWGLCDMTISWLIWSIDIEFNRGNSTCR